MNWTKNISDFKVVYDFYNIIHFYNKFLNIFDRKQINVNKIANNFFSYTKTLV